MKDRNGKRNKGKGGKKDFPINYESGTVTEPISSIEILVLFGP